MAVVRAGEVGTHALTYTAPHLTCRGAENAAAGRRSGAQHGWGAERGRRCVGARACVHGSVWVHACVRACDARARARATGFYVGHAHRLALTRISRAHWRACACTRPGGASTSQQQPSARPAAGAGAAPAAGASGAAPAAAVAGPSDPKLSQLMALGYTREQADAALRAAGGNVEAAAAVLAFGDGMM